MMPPMRDGGRRWSLHIAVNPPGPLPDCLHLGIILKLPMISQDCTGDWRLERGFHDMTPTQVLLLGRLPALLACRRWKVTGCYHAGLNWQHHRYHASCSAVQALACVALCAWVVGMGGRQQLAWQAGWGVIYIHEGTAPGLLRSSLSSLPAPMIQHLDWGMGWDAYVCLWCQTHTFSFLLPLFPALTESQGRHKTRQAGMIPVERRCLGRGCAGGSPNPCNIHETFTALVAGVFLGPL